MERTRIERLEKNEFQHEKRKYAELREKLLLSEIFDSIEPGWMLLDTTMHHYPYIEDVVVDALDKDAPFNYSIHIDPDGFNAFQNGPRRDELVKHSENTQIFLYLLDNRNHSPDYKHHLYIIILNTLRSEYIKVPFENAKPEILHEAISRIEALPIFSQWYNAHEISHSLKTASLSLHSILSKEGFYHPVSESITLSTIALAELAYFSNMEPGHDDPSMDEDEIEQDREWIAEQVSMAKRQVTMLLTHEMIHHLSFRVIEKNDDNFSLSHFGIGAEWTWINEAITELLTREAFADKINELDEFSHVRPYQSEQKVLQALLQKTNSDLNSLAAIMLAPNEAFFQAKQKELNALMGHLSELSPIFTQSGEEKAMQYIDSI